MTLNGNSKLETRNSQNAMRPLAGYQFRFSNFDLWPSQAATRARLFVAALGCAVSLISALAVKGSAVNPISARSDTQAPDTILSQAAELVRTKDYAGAERLYRQALLAAPDDPEILKSLGSVCQAEGKYDESIEVLQRILKRAPLYPGVNSLLGMSYFALGKLDKTIQATQKELSGNPKDRQARHYLALALSASGRLFEAIQQLESLRADDPKDAAVLYQLVVDYRAATQQAGERLAKLYPDSDFTHAIDAEVYADNGRLDEAILEFKEVLRKNPDFPGIHFALGEVYWRKIDAANALPQLKLALQEDPKQPLAHYYLADILTTQNEYQEAMGHLQVTIAAYPQLKRAYLLLGKCYAGTGDLHRALDVFNKALELDPNYPEAHYQLHQLYARLGDKQQSEAHLETFQRLTKEGQDRDKQLLREAYQKQAGSKSDNQ